MCRRGHAAANLSPAAMEIQNVSKMKCQNARHELYTRCIGNWPQAAPSVHIHSGTWRSDRPVEYVRCNLNNGTGASDMGGLVWEHPIWEGINNPFGTITKEHIHVVGEPGNPDFRVDSVMFNLHLFRSPCRRQFVHKPTTEKIIP